MVSSRSRRLGALLLSVPLFAFTAPAALAQGDTGQATPQVSVEDLLRAAYGLRRQGRYKVAGAAFEQAMQRIPDRKRKKAIALELAQLFQVTGRHDKALLLFRRNHDVPNEVETLLLMDKPDRALAVSRFLKYPQGEAKALIALGQQAEALQLMEEHGRLMAKERADLLMDLGRYVEAAEVYESCNDLFGQAGALEKAGRQALAKRTYLDAVDQVQDDVREIVRTYKRHKDAYRKLPDGIERERARFLLAQECVELAESYRRYAIAYRGAGEDPAKARRFAENAVKYYKRSREVHLDVKRGGCQFGQEAVKVLGHDARIAELEAELATYPRK